MAEARGCAGFDEDERAGAERPGCDEERLGLLGRQLCQNIAEYDEICWFVWKIAVEVGGELRCITQRR